MKKSEAMKIIKDELADKLNDKRTKISKAVKQIDDFIKWDEARLEQIIDETIEQFEINANDYKEDGNEKAD
jgi:hypothetical protein